MTASTEFEYDSNGNETVIVDADDRRIESLWDALGNQLNLAIDPAGLNLRRQFTYTASGFLLTDTAPNGDVTRFTVDPRTGDATSWVDVDGRATPAEYDRAGNVTRATDPDGRATQLTYDGSGPPAVTNRCAGENHDLQLRCGRQQAHGDHDPNRRWRLGNYEPV